MTASVRAGPLAEVVRSSLDDRLSSFSREPADGAVAAHDGAPHRRDRVPGLLRRHPVGDAPGLRGRTFTLASSASRWVRLRGAAVVAAARAGFAAGPDVARADEEAVARGRGLVATPTLIVAAATVER